MKIGNRLVGKRLVIRDYSPDDLPFVTGMWFDEENGKYMSDPTAEYVDEEYQKALDEMHECDSGYYLIIQAIDSDELLGTCCAFPGDEQGSYDIGYCIRKDHWRQGYGTEAIGLLIEWIKSLGGRKITAEVAIENAGSVALLRKFGFHVVKETEFKKYRMDIVFKSRIYELSL